MSLRKIVIVDDEDDIREVLRHAIEFAKDWHVLDARDGEEGLALIVRELPDAVLLDVMMPKLGGREVFRALKKDDATAGIPVVFLTASLQKQDLRDLELLGPRAVLAKPFDPMTIADQIEQALGWNRKD